MQKKYHKTGRRFLKLNNHNQFIFILLFVSLFVFGCAKKPDPTELYKEGIILAENDCESAITKFNAAIELDSNFAEAFSARGLCYMTLKKTSEAEFNALQALKIFPNDYRSYITLGVVHIMKNKPEEGFSYLKKAEEINPFAYEVNKALANYYYYTVNDCDKTIEYGNKSLNSRPQDQYSLGLINLCYVE